jgi:outer membrane protein assembly factor BamB
VVVALVAGYGATSAFAGSLGATCLGYAVAHHENASHNGNSCTTLPARPSRLWSTTLVGSASYPLIADRMVFVATADTSARQGWLYGLYAKTGATAWGPVPLGAYQWFSIAYGDGRVFVNNFDGTVAAYDALTGSEEWAHTTAYFSGEPVYYKGVVYVQGDGPLYALSAKTGALLWATGKLDGDGAPLAANDAGVFLAAGCSRYAFSNSGSLIWSRNDGCSSGGGSTSYLNSATSRVFEDGFVVQGSSGDTVGTYSGVPAFLGRDGYFVSGQKLFAEDTQTLTQLFSVVLPSPSNTSPVIAGRTLYVGALDSKVYALSTSNGAVLWSGDLPGVPGGGAQYSSPESDIAVGQKLLVVPTGNIVTAFG